ncbi:MAG: VanZ family protein [Oscillospiraceae bacterium]|jgi:glycopeptide antibiotics resistance protein|nr:VanZ family protein [Oscillospiraceae bacterium]
MPLLLRGLCAPPKRSPPQLLLLPLAAGLGYFLSAQASFAFIGRLGCQLATALLGGLLLTLAVLPLPGGQRACAIGLGAFLCAMLLWAAAAQLRAQKAAGYPGGWIGTFYYDRPMAVLCVASAALFLPLLLRVILPQQEAFAQQRRNFSHAMRIMTPCMLFFYAALLLYGFFFVRKSGASASYNFLPLAMLRYYYTALRAQPWLAYEHAMYVLGNIFLFTPMGFFLRGYFKRSWKVALLLPAAFSFLMEIIQLIFHLGHCDADDFFLNTGGAALGCLLAAAPDWLRKAITHGAEAEIWGRQ